MAVLKSALPLVHYGNPVPYQYSYYLDRRKEVATKLGLPASVESLITENGSISISAAANWLLSRRVKNILLVRPAYFTTRYALERLGLAVREAFEVRTRGGFSFPVKLDVHRDEALWVTNPTYNTGVYHDEVWLADLKAQLEQRPVIVDESLASAPSGVAAVLGGHPNFIGIYTPHKSICMNALKFSLVAFHPDQEDIFDDWADVLAGALSLSAAAAVGHFLSEPFDTYKTAFLSFLDLAGRWHRNAIAKLAGRVEIDDDARGHFCAVYFPNLPAALGDDLNFMERVIERTGAVCIHGTRSGFDPAWGFSFRVNLAQDCPGFRGALIRLYQYLSAQSS
jgi:hypothetical protein